MQLAVDLQGDVRILRVKEAKLTYPNLSAFLAEVRRLVEEGTRKLHAVSQWVPRLIYLAVVFAVAFFIIRYYTGYFQQLQNLGF